MATRRGSANAPAARGRPATWLVECYQPGMRRTVVDADAARAREVAGRLSDDGGSIEYLGALLVAADEVVFHAFRAHDADSVRAASLQAGLDYERIVEAVTVGLEVVGGFDIGAAPAASAELLDS